MNPEELLYCETHEWVHMADGVATIGISAFAVEQLTDVVGIELPAVGQELAAGDEFGTAESVKAVSPLYCPVAGKVVEVNESLEDDFEIFNSDPYGKGWIVKLQVSDEAGLSSLMDYASYQKQCAEEG